MSEIGGWESAAARDLRRRRRGGQKKTLGGKSAFFLSPSFFFLILFLPSFSPTPPPLGMLVSAVFYSHILHKENFKRSTKKKYKCRSRPFREPTLSLTVNTVMYDNYLESILLNYLFSPFNILSNILENHVYRTSGNETGEKVPPTTTRRKVYLRPLPGDQEFCPLPKWYSPRAILFVCMHHRDEVANPPVSRTRERNDDEVC